MKNDSAFYPEEVRRHVSDNVRNTYWGRASRDAMVETAGPWLARSDDELWEAMFGPTISRSWMVWSDGYCPACRGQTPMYTWEIDALARPWSVRCPHCHELFPKNDFRRYYRSGLDVHGVFDPGRADRSVLYNMAHPDPGDPLHAFGVDDGEGYVDGDRRWRFIGAYLVYGQWKQFVLGGIKNLSAAYVVTGDSAYARKTGILLDRVADLYPSFDFQTQGLVYEERRCTGYVSTWHDACEETRELAEAYDRVFPALAGNDALLEFLKAKAAACQLPNPKRTWSAVQRNIEDGILKDPLDNAAKIHSNYPRQENALLVLRTVLDWPANRGQIYELLDDVLDTATAVDGVTGEKGTAGYATIGPRAVAQIMGLFARLEPGLLKEVYARHPRLRELFRFHIDTRCLGRYYPHVGDSGRFVSPVDRYAGAEFSAAADLEPSSFTFMMELYELTGDPAFVQVLYEGNGGTVEGLPHDLFASDPVAFQRRVEAVIARYGTEPALASVNKQEWHLALLRSGGGAQRRCLWLHYDAGGRHSHRDGLNLGLFSHGADVLPELGYPPVQFGGWGSPRAQWYKMTASHNTVVVDGCDQEDGAGRTTLWADGATVRAIRVSAPALYESLGVDKYERTALLVDVDAEHSYVVDVFRVRGGSDHARFLHSGFGSLEVPGVDWRPTAPYRRSGQMRRFLAAEHAPPGWHADWKLRFPDCDQTGRPPVTATGLRCTDLTLDATVCRAESWVSLGYDAENAEAWIPSLIVRRQGRAPLESTFVQVLAPHGGKCPVQSVRRLSLRDRSGTRRPHTDVGLEVILADGRRDLILVVDPEHAPAGSGVQVHQPDWRVWLEGELCWARRVCQEEGGQRDAGPVAAMALMRGAGVWTEHVAVISEPGTPCTEMRLSP